MKPGDQITLTIRVNGRSEEKRGEITAVSLRHVEVKLEDGRTVCPFASQVKRGMRGE